MRPSFKRPPRVWFWWPQIRHAQFWLREHHKHLSESGQGTDAARIKKLIDELENADFEQWPGGYKREQ